MPNITIYTKDYCPYCKQAIALLLRKGVEKSQIQEIDITNSEELQAEALEESGGRKTVPQIFIGETHVGGFNDLSALNDKGELNKLLSYSPPKNTL